MGAEYCNIVVNICTYYMLLDVSPTQNTHIILPFKRNKRVTVILIMLNGVMRYVFLLRAIFVDFQ